MPYLACVDCDRMQEFIFQSPRLRHIRNCSHFISEMDTTVPRLAECFGALQTAAAGGVAWAVFDDRLKAVEFMRRTIAGYHAWGIGATGQVLEVNDSVTSNDMTRLYRSLRAVKDGPVGGTAVVAAPPLKECVVRGVPPAIKEVTLPDGRREYASAEGGQIHDGEPGLFPELRQRLVKSSGRWQSFTWPEDIDQLLTGLPAGKAQQREVEGRLLGVVYADANGMGERLAAFQGSFDDYCTIAQALRTAVLDAVASAVASSMKKELDCRASLNPSISPFVPLILGGDDVALACPAEHALYLARDLCREFQCLTATGRVADLLKCGQGIGMGVGVAITHRGFPLSQSFRMARSLQRSAKKRATALRRQEQPQEVSCVDFEVHFGSYAREVWELRPSVPPERGTQRRLTAKPYIVMRDGGATPGNGWWTLDQLLAAAECAVRGVGGRGSQTFWKQLREVHAGHPERAKLRTREMLRIQERSQDYEAVLRAFGLNCGAEVWPYRCRSDDPWQPENCTKLMVSPVMDVAEIFRLVKTRLG